MSKVVALGSWADLAGYAAYLSRYEAGLAIEHAAVAAL